MSASYGENNSSNERAGKRFEIGLTKDGRVVHLYHLGGGRTQAITLPTPLARRLPPSGASAPRAQAPNVLGTTGLPRPQHAAGRRARRPRVVTYGNADRPTTP
jgi:hypothetical protein